MLKRQHLHSRGAALIVALFALLLITIVVLAFFGQANLNRKISFSSASQARANILALTAMDCIKADLIAEIQAGSTVATLSGTDLILDASGSFPAYSPRANANMLPYRMSGTAITSGIPTNLIKWSSSGSSFWQSNNGYQFSNTGSILAVNVTTTTSSQNDRYIDPVRWIKPVFSDTSTDLAITPEWVLMTRQGPLANPSDAQSLLTSGSLSNTSANNPNYVIGRYAFIIYDEGGLLDINATGYPNGTFATDIGRKGNQGYADLTQLGLNQSQINQLIDWRNATSKSNYASYLSGTAAQYGFLKTANGDNAFVSRQDFIQFWIGTLNADPSYLKYFTTFSREKNAPSWGPEFNASGSNSNGQTSPYWTGSNTVTPDVSSYTGGASVSGSTSYAYYDNRDTNTLPSGQVVYNRFFPNVRVTSTFTRLTGEIANTGESLVKYRFDLNKLSWINHSGTLPPNVSAADVYRNFGLVYVTGSGGYWAYDHSQPNPPPDSTNAPSISNLGGPNILTLGQVASLPSNYAREPDFFELLQAAILQGSMGFINGDPNSVNSTNGRELYRLYAVITSTNAASMDVAPTVRTDSNFNLVASQIKYHIMQIGANMIGQNGSDNFPTEFALNGVHFYSLKNLPYINAIGDALLRPAPAPGSLPSDLQPYSLGGYITSSNAGNFPSADQAYVHRWMTFSLWNPNQNAAASTTYGNNGPQNIRIRVSYGQLYPTTQTIWVTSGTGYLGMYFSATGAASSLTVAGTPTVIYKTGPSWIGVHLSGTNTFSEPTNIDATNAYTNDANNPASGNINDGYGIVTTSGTMTASSGNTTNWQRAGIYMGWSLSPDYGVNGTQVTLNGTVFSATVSGTAAVSGSVWYGVPLCVKAAIAGRSGWQQVQGAGTKTAVFGPRTGLVFPYVELQYEDINNPGTWHTYQQLPSLVHYRNSGGNPYFDYSLGAADGYVAAILDPRTTRMNISSPRYNAPSYLTFTATNYYNITSITVNQPTGPYFIGNSALMATWVNNTGTTSSYKDRDFNTRIGDAGGWSSSSTATPLASGPNNTLRPIQLNRPFRNVAELGYVYRDDPWKTLNLVSANSADAGLLDIFCIGPNSQYIVNSGTWPQTPSVVAGKININSLRSTAATTSGSAISYPILNAILAQTIRDYTFSGTTVTPNSPSIPVGDYSDLDKALTITSTTPLSTSVGGLTQLVTQGTSISNNFPGNKGQREAFVRALAGNSQVRTWNLLIDIVAQTGKYTPNGTSLDKFIVEGEKHYWLHVAIDRFTGEIVDQQLEPVSE
ncbi:MAG: hypothetical protein LBH01_07305 [Verrucomicrobiales bacterium]|jgi:Tfp pilus assembly protein PilX|nr:hypothetical protein [Verrucomicrobiales bacterium]